MPSGVSLLDIDDLFEFDYEATTCFLSEFRRRKTWKVGTGTNFQITEIIQRTVEPRKLISVPIFLARAIDNMLCMNWR